MRPEPGPQAPGCKAQEAGAPRSAQAGSLARARAGPSRPFSIHLLRLVLAVALPLVVFALSLLVWAAEARRADLLRGIDDTTLSLQSAIERDIGFTIAMLEALATSPALDAALSAGAGSAGVAPFHAQAMAIIARRPSALGAIFLFDAARDEPVVNSLVPPGEPIPRIAAAFFPPRPIGARPTVGSAVRQAVATGEPHVGDLVRGVTAGWILPVTVPVRREGRIVAVVAAAIRPASLAATLRQQLPAEGGIGVLVDRGGIVVARTADEDRHLGNPAVPAAVAFQAQDVLAATGPSVTAEGQAVYGAARRLTLAPFAVAYGAPRSVVDAPLNRAFLLAGGGCMAALLMAIGAATWQGRRLGREVAALRADALLLAGGQALPPSHVPRIAEVEAARDALLRSASALAESEARFIRAVAAARMGTWEWDAATNILTGSPGREALYGLEPGALPTREALLDAVHPEDRETVSAAADRALLRDGDGRYWAEFRTVWPDGTLRWLRTQGRAELAADGTPMRISGAVVDVTEHRLAAAALRDSERRLRLAQEAAGIGVWERDLVTGEASWSDHEFRLHGLEPAATPPDADALRAMIVPEDQARTTLLFERLRNVAIASEEHGAAAGMEYRIRRADTGAVRWLQVFGRALPGADGKPARVIGVSLDVTERREAEQRQALLMREVDHRAKNALAVALSVVQLAPRNLAPEAFAAVVTGRIAAMARAHSLLAEERWAGADLATLAAGEFAAHADHVRIEGPAVRLAPGAAQPVAMLLHELGTNASKHGSLSVHGGRAALTWEGVEGGLRLQWREFGALRSSGAPSGTGFGLRLMTALARQQLGGTISFDWTGTEGVVVTVQIPARHVAGPSVEAAPPAPGTARMPPG